MADTPGEVSETDTSATGVGCCSTASATGTSSGALTARPPDDPEVGVADDGPAPLESDPADWQEQREIVEDPDDDFR